MAPIHHQRILAGVENTAMSTNDWQELVYLKQFSLYQTSATWDRIFIKFQWNVVTISILWEKTGLSMITMGSIPGKSTGGTRCVGRGKRVDRRWWIMCSYVERGTKDVRRLEQSVEMWYEFLLIMDPNSWERLTQKRDTYAEKWKFGEQGDLRWEVLS